VKTIIAQRASWQWHSYSDRRKMVACVITLGLSWWELGMTCVTCRVVVASSANVGIIRGIPATLPPIQVEENSRRLRVISDYVPKVPRNGVREHRNYELSVNATELPLSTDPRPSSHFWGIEMSQKTGILRQLKLTGPPWRTRYRRWFAWKLGQRPRKIPGGVGCSTVFRWGKYRDRASVWSI